MLLSAQVADLYFAYRTTLLRIDIAERNAAIQKRSLEITEKIFKAGQDSELDVQQAKTQYLATLATIPDLQATLVRQRNALAALLGRKPGEVPELASVQGPLPAVEPLVVPGNPGRAAAAPAGHPHGRLAGRRAVGADRRRESRLLPGHHAVRQHRLEREFAGEQPGHEQPPRRSGADAGTCSTSGGFAAMCACRTPACSRSIEAIPGQRAPGCA